MPALSGAEGSPLSEAKGLPIAFITAIAATKCWLGLVGETVNLVFLFVAFLFGASLGSFLNVVIDRIPLDKSLVRPPSHCDACGVRLSASELVPVVSYLFLKGRCRHCSARVPVRVLLVELAGGAGAAVVFPAYGVTAFGLLVYLSGMVLLALSLIDIEQGIVPDAIIVPATGVALLAAVFIPELGWKPALLGGAIAFGVLLLPAVLKPGGIGWGDVKLAPLLGIVTGFPAILFALFASFLLGGLTAVVVLMLGKGTRKTPLPFVPFLATGTILGLVWGRAIVSWYLGLF